MKFVSLALSLLALSCASNAEPVHNKPIYVPSGLYYQKLSFTELRGIEINSKEKTAQWVQRSCDVVFNTCQETRSKPMPVKYDNTSIEVLSLDEEANISQPIRFEYAPESKSLFHPSQGDYVKAPEILKVSK